MSGRTITLHVFCSAKGGVGKSTLAVACARLIAEQSRPVVLLDADFTGTSVADGLRLCAPEVARLSDGNLDFDAAPTGRHLTREQTLAQRNKRRDAVPWEDRPPAPPYLNDLLIYENREGAECQVEALLWKHEHPDGVLYLPSSPCPTDVSLALAWIYREEPFSWLQRLMWLLDGMSKQMTTLGDVVIDLPPGLFGFAHEALALVSNLQQKTEFPSGFPVWNRGGVRWKGNPFLVTSLDHNDLILALEYRLAQRKHLPHLELVLNRYATSRESELRAFIRARFDEALGVEALIPSSSRISELGPLRELFTREELYLSDEVRKLRAALRLEEAR
jgi:CO dehydrogenase nickel-insertion accessory protein CooC1